MMQSFLLCEVFLTISSLLILLDSYRESLSFLLRFRTWLQDNKWGRNLFSVIGFAISLLVLLFPVDPGPMIIGDIIPALAVFGLVLFFRKEYSGEGAVFAGTELGKGRRILGYIVFGIALLHFIVPSFVLI